MKTTYNPTTDQICLKYTSKEQQLFGRLIRPIKTFIKSEDLDPDMVEDFKEGLGVIETLSWSTCAEVDAFEAGMALDLVCFRIYLSKTGASGRLFHDALSVMALWPCVYFSPDGPLPPATKVFSKRAATDEVKKLYQKLCSFKARQGAYFTTLELYHLWAFLNASGFRLKALADLELWLYSLTNPFNLAVTRSTTARKFATGLN